MLGKVGAWSLEAARQHARALRVDVDKDIDPFGKSGSAAPRWTLADAWKRYERDYLPALSLPKTAVDHRAMWRDYILPSWARSASTKSISSTGNAAPKHCGTYRANRAHETLRHVLNLCVKWKWIDRNPAIGLEVNRETPRNSYLKVDQTRAVLAALPHTESVMLIRLLVLTGARLGEVVGMRWDQLDLAAGIWTKPAASTKQRREHRVPLSPAPSS